MTCEDAFAYLMEFSWKIGTTAMEEMNKTEGDRFREAVRTLKYNICTICSDQRWGIKDE